MPAQSVKGRPATVHLRSSIFNLPLAPSPVASFRSDLCAEKEMPCFIQSTLQQVAAKVIFALQCCATRQSSTRRVPPCGRSNGMARMVFAEPFAFRKRGRAQPATTCLGLKALRPTLTPPTGGLPVVCPPNRRSKSTIPPCPSPALPFWDRGGATATPLKLGKVWWTPGPITLPVGGTGDNVRPVPRTKNSKRTCARCAAWRLRTSRSGFARRLKTMSGGARPTATSAPGGRTLNHRAQCCATDPSPKRQRGVGYRSLALPARKEWCVNAHGHLGLDGQVRGVLPGDVAGDVLA